MMVPDYALIG
jgi:dynein heavy chain, axonemal